MELKTPLLFQTDAEAQDFLAARIILDNTIKSDSFGQFLKHLNQLGVKEILLSCPLSVLERLFKEDLSLIKIFNDFKVSVLFFPDLNQFFSIDPGKSRKYLLNSLFCNKQYFKRHQILGFPVFHFWGQTPEIYSLNKENKIEEIQIPQPEDVHSIFLIRNSDNGDIDLQVREITDRFNRQTGKIDNCPVTENEEAIVVLRSYYICDNTAQPFQINYFDSSALAALQKHFKLNLQRLPFHAESIVYPLDKMFDISQTINRVHYTPTLEKVLNGIKKTIAYYYYKSSAQLDNFFIKIVFKRFFTSVLKSRLEVISSKVQYVLNADAPLVHVLAADQQYILDINHKKFNLEAPYFWQSFSALKQMASEAFANNQDKISLLFSSLIKPGFSIVEQKFYFDVLTQAGATKFWLNIELPHVNAIPDVENFQLKSDYLNQLVHFLNKGIPATRILLLIPSLDLDKTNYYKSIEVVAKAGVPFELISFDHFVSDTSCKIDQKKILFNKQPFDLLLLPAIHNIPYRVLKKLFIYFKNGGHLAALCYLPEKAEVKEKQKKFKKLKSQLWINDEKLTSISFVQDDSEGRSYFIPKLSELTTFLSFYLQKNAIYLEGENILTRIKETQNSFFVFLTNLLSDQNNEALLKSKIVTQPFFWDFSEKKQIPVYYWNHFSDQLEIPLRFAPWESKLIILPKNMGQLKHWHLAFCSVNEFILEVSQQNSFIIYLLPEQLGPVDILLENHKKQISSALMITEIPEPVILPDDHWVLEAPAFKKVIHLNDIESLLTPEISLIKLRNSFMLKQYRPDYEYFLELNTLQHKCEVRINDKKVASRWYPPFRFKLGPFLKAGENQIDIILNRGMYAQANILTPIPKFQVPAPLKIKIFKKFVIKTETD